MDPLHRITTRIKELFVNDDAKINNESKGRKLLTSLLRVFEFENVLEITKGCLETEQFICTCTV